MPDVDQLYQRFAGQDIVVLGVHQNERGDLLSDFVEQTGITFEVVNDPGTLELFAFPVGVGYPYPRDVVIGKDLTVRSIRNSFSVDEMEQLLTDLLAE